MTVQQEIFPRASVEASYHRRWFTQFFTGGTVTDNLLVGPNDLAAMTLTAPRDARLPDGGGYTVGPLYNLNPNVFGQTSNLISSTKDVGDDTRVFNGFDVQLNVRAAHGLTINGGTSTGKVENDWCAIRDAVPESYTLNPYCHTESPWQTSFRAMVAYTIPRIDVLLSGVFNNRPNIGTDQIGSLLANYSVTAADQAVLAAQIGRALTPVLPTFTVNLLSPGQDVRRSREPDRLLGEEDPPFRGSASDRGSGLLQPLEQQRHARVQPDVRAERARVERPDDVHEPARRSSERRVRLVDTRRDCRMTNGQCSMPQCGVGLGVGHSSIEH